MSKTEEIDLITTNKKRKREMKSEEIFSQFEIAACLFLPTSFVRYKHPIKLYNRFIKSELVRARIYKE